jgi:hypothetical protein
MRTFLLTLFATLILAVPAAADKGGGHPGDTSPGNSGKHKVTICHHAGPTKTITITVDEHALPAHLGHGDSIGACPPAEVVTPPPVTPPATDTTPAAAPEQPYAIPQAPAESPVEAPAPPAQVVAHERAGGKHHAKRVARVHRQQAVLARRVAVARSQGALPYTGLPAGLIAGLGLTLLATGLAIRRRLCYSS